MCASLGLHSAAVAHSEGGVVHLDPEDLARYIREPRALVVFQLFPSFLLHQSCMYHNDVTSFFFSDFIFTITEDILSLSFFV